MNFQNILQEIEKVDPEVYDRLDTRRHSLRSFAGIGKKMALTALPLALGGLFKKAYGQTSTMPSVVDILNFALTLEQLEAEFYTIGTGTSGLIIDNEKHSFDAIKAHETSHVALLTSTIQSLGGTPGAKPTFDFTAGGAFPDAFSNFDTFIALSQAFEDTGVRAYKGQANNPNLMANDAVLTVALQIHSVEARHASHLRKLRMSRGGAASANKPWITGNDRGGEPSQTQPVYNGEDVTTQSTLNITSFKGADGTTNISTNAATEAFDEPLDMASVLTIASLFIKK